MDAEDIRVGEWYEVHVIDRTPTGRTSKILSARVISVDPVKGGVTVRRRGSDTNEWVNESQVRCSWAERRREKVLRKQKERDRAARFQEISALVEQVEDLLISLGIDVQVVGRDGGWSAGGGQADLRFKAADLRKLRVLLADLRGPSADSDLADLLA